MKIRIKELDMTEVVVEAQLNRLFMAISTGDLRKVITQKESHDCYRN